MNIQSLLDLLYSEPDIEKRRYIPDKLAKLGDWASTHPLGKLIIDHNQPDLMRNEAVESLGKQGDPKAIQYLVQVLKDEIDDIRRTAVWSLGQIGTSECLDPIFSMKHDPNEDVRRWVAKSAGRVRDDNVINYLKQYIHDLSFEEERVLADIIRGVSSQVKRLKEKDFQFWATKCYEILSSNVKNYVKQASILLLNELFKRGIEPDVDILKKLFSTLPVNDPLVRPNIIISMGYAKEIEFLKELDHTNAIVALGIAGEREILEKYLKNEDDLKVIAALEGFKYISGIPDLEIFYNHDNLTIQSNALQLHAMNSLPIDHLVKAYNEKRGKFKMLELLRYYHDEALYIYEKTAVEEEKVARQNTVYSLMSEEMLDNVKNLDKVKEILTQVSSNERIWHIRRDARIGIERIENNKN